MVSVSTLMYSKWFCCWFWMKSLHYCLFHQFTNCPANWDATVERVNHLILQRAMSGFVAFFPIDCIHSSTFWYITLNDIIPCFIFLISTSFESRSYDWQNIFDFILIHDPSSLNWLSVNCLWCSISSFGIVFFLNR